LIYQATDPLRLREMYKSDSHYTRIFRYQEFENRQVDCKDRNLIKIVHFRSESLNVNIRMEANIFMKHLGHYM
ncbi:hypothetical protein L9F63_013423, partial [Diploptera punctata]